MHIIVEEIQEFKRPQSEASLFVIKIKTVWSGLIITKLLIEQKVALV